MNVRKKYPKLFRKLSRIFGARKAKRILLEVDKNPEDAIDSNNFSTTLFWSTSVQGFDYWSNLQLKIDPDWGK